MAEAGGVVAAVRALARLGEAATVTEEKEEDREVAAVAAVRQQDWLTSATPPLTAAAHAPSSSAAHAPSSSAEQSRSAVDASAEGPGSRVLGAGLSA